MNAVESRVDQELLRASRKQMLLDSFGLSLSTIGFGLVYGLAAREVGLTPVDVSGHERARFCRRSAVRVLGYIGAGAPWLSIVLVTALINAGISSTAPSSRLTSPTCPLASEPRWRTR
jgi:predicted branched-subunit amino acid permease